MRVPGSILGVATRETLARVILVLVSEPLAPPGTWSLDPSRSLITWSVRHLGVNVVHGEFAEFSGLLADGRATGVVAAASVLSDDPRRDEYVRSPEFLDATTFPELRFATDLSLATDGSLTGDLTIRGTTLPLTLTVERPQTTGEQIRLRLTGTVLRRAYGLRFPQAFGAADRSVTDEVEIALDLVLVPEP